MSEYPTLQTARLRLRAFSLEDAPAVQRLAGAREIASSTLNIPHPYPDGAAEEWIGRHREQFETGRGLHLAVVRRDTGELIGAVGLGIEPIHKRAEIGYWIAVPCWDQGYATEAARELIRYGFQSLGLNRILGRHPSASPCCSSSSAS